MGKTSERKKDPFLIWMLLAVPVVFIVSAPLHFLYGWLGRSVAAGLFAPVNESVWEHLKLTFWPLLIWWIIGWLLYGRKKSALPDKIAVTGAVAEIVCMVFIVAFFYTYTGAFGIESLALDIILLLLGLVVAVAAARCVYLRAKPGGMAAFLAVVVLTVLAAAFIYFTFAPPHLPLFQDPETGLYGISA